MGSLGTDSIENVQNGCALYPRVVFSLPKSFICNIYPNFGTRYMFALQFLAGHDCTRIMYFAFKVLIREEEENLAKQFGTAYSD